MSTFSTRLRSSREACGMTQAELAHRVGYNDRRTISQYEQGVREPGIVLIRDLAEALNVSPCWLAGWERDDGRTSTSDS